MNRKITTIALLAALCAGLTAAARQPARGYRGFADWCVGLGSEKLYWGERHCSFYTGASTTHGYQINRHVFVGAGLDFEVCADYDRTIFAFYADTRYDARYGIFTPFADLRLGYASSGGGGIYFSPTLGHRFNWGRKAAVNIGVGLTLRTRDTDRYQYSPGTSDGSVELRPTGSGKTAECTFALRLGLDF